MSLLPDSASGQNFIKISPLNGGWITFPLRLFVAGLDPDAKKAVPSMCFLIQHHDASGKLTRIVFDLGIKRDVTQYPHDIQQLLKNRQPVTHLPDTAASLRAGGLNPATDIDIVILSHIHWDHVGTPTDYPNSKFVVGSGTIYTAKNGAKHCPISHLGPEPLPIAQAWELPPPKDSPTKPLAAPAERQLKDLKWAPISTLPNAVDFFGDGSIYLIDAPGHLQGHLNLLARVAPGKWVYLGGDCCHDTRLLWGEKEIAEFEDGHGGKRTIHMDVETAKDTLSVIRKFLEVNGEKVKWIIAHDEKWANENKGHFFPGSI